MYVRSFLQIIVNGALYAAPSQRKTFGAVAAALHLREGSAVARFVETSAGQFQDRPRGVFFAAVQHKQAAMQRERVSFVNSDRRLHFARTCSILR